MAYSVNAPGSLSCAVMYFTPSILELAGFHNKRTALLVAMLPAGVNALGTVAGAFAIDRAGRRCVGNPCEGHCRAADAGFASSVGNSQWLAMHVIASTPS